MGKSNIILTLGAILAPACFCASWLQMTAVTCSFAII